MTNEHGYIFPPRPDKALPKKDAKEYLEHGWRPQLKFNDTRIIIKMIPEGQSINVELWNRHGEKLKNYHLGDDLKEQVLNTSRSFGLDLSKEQRLDGGLLDQKHRAIKDTIVIWDILVKDGIHLLGTSYLERHKMLVKEDQKDWLFEHPELGKIKLGRKVEENVILTEFFDNSETTYEKLWEFIDAINRVYTIDNNIKPLIEGLVIKDPNGELEFGFKEKNNTSWQVKTRVVTGRHRF